MDLHLDLKSAVLLLTFTGMVCGYCSDIYNDTKDQTVFICTNTSKREYTRVVYFDGARVQASSSSSCRCNIQLEGSQSHTLKVKLDVKIRDSGKFTVVGFGQNFSSESTVENITGNVNTTTQNNDIMFNITKENKDSLKACIRVVIESGNSKTFNVSCQTAGDNSPTTTSSTSGKTHSHPETSFNTDGHTLQATPSTGELSLGTDDSGQGIAPIIGGAVGGALLVILGVVAVIIVIKKRKTHQPDNEEYEVTENAMYGATKTIQQAAEYETIDTKLTGKGSSLYSDKSSGDNNTALRGKPDTPENEYNHLNDVSPVFFTGNVYSSTGNTYSSTGSNQLDEHQVGSGNVYDRLSAQTHGQKNINKADNVYD